MASQEVATREDNEYKRLERQLATRAIDFAKSLPSNIPPDKFQRTIITAVAKKPNLLNCDRQSLILACFQAANDGLLPDGREAALVEFTTRVKNPQSAEWEDKLLVQYMSMAYGIRQKILESSDVKALAGRVVYREEVEKGCFHYEEGTERSLRHTPLELIDPTFEPKDENIVAAYSLAVLADGTKTFEIVFRSYINKVRQMSQTGAIGRTVKYGKEKGKEIPPKGPWVDWFPEQCLKTAVRVHSKTLPMRGEIRDVEAQQLAISTASVDQALSHAPAVSLPTRAETAAMNAAMQEQNEATAESEGGDDDASDDQQDEPKQQRKRKTPAKAQQKAEESQQEQGESQQDGDEPHPARAKADEIIGEAAAVPNIMDLNSLKSRVKGDVAAMPDEIAAEVHAALDAAEARVRGGNGQ